MNSKTKTCRSFTSGSNPELFLHPLQEVPASQEQEDGSNRVFTADDPHRMLDVDLDQPLRDDERLPVRQYVSSEIQINLLNHPVIWEPLIASA